MNPLRILAGALALGTLSLPLAAQTSVHVLAQIDGRSRLILAGDTAQWQHFDFAAPGRLDCDLGVEYEPTLIDGNEWWPTWADLPDCDNRDCGGCTSDVLSGIAPALPLADFQVLLDVISARGPVTVVEHPSAANGYRVVIEFNDNFLGGADWYEVELFVVGCGSFESTCTSTPNSTGQAATMGLAGSLSVAVNDLHLLAFDCPPGRPGLFFFGSNPAQLPFGDGYLCVSPYYPGLYRAAAPLGVDGAGGANLQLDLAALPAGAQIVAGSTWYFQFWFRDHAAGGTGTNLTDGLRVTFCP